MKIENKKTQEELIKVTNVIFIGASIIVVIICGIFASLLISSGVSLQQKAIDSENWLITTGTILSSEVEYRSPEEWEEPGYIPRITYGYSIQGENYTGTRISFYLDFIVVLLEESETLQFTQKYPRRANVSVYYNPSDHSESVLEPGTNDILNTHWRMSSFLVLALGVLFTFICRLFFYKRVSIISIKLYGVLTINIGAIFGIIVFYVL